MDVVVYVDRINEICDAFGGPEGLRCDDCPLMNLQCGVFDYEVTGKDIQKVVEAIEGKEIKKEHTCKDCDYAFPVDRFNYCPICGKKREIVFEQKGRDD